MVDIVKGNVFFQFLKEVHLSLFNVPIASEPDERESHVKKKYHCCFLMRTKDRKEKSLDSFEGQDV